MRQAFGCALALTCGLARASECADDCGIVDLDTGALCHHVGYSACRTHGSWAAQDRAVLAAFGGRANSSVASLRRASAADPCLLELINVHCAIGFSACEIGLQTKPLCDGECDKVASGCEQTFTQGHSCKALRRDAETGVSCVPLDYDGPNKWLWVAGCTIAVVFSILSTLGANIQKYSMQRDKERGWNRVELCQPFWLMGQFLLTVGAFVDFVAFGMAPQSLIAPIAALSLVWNMLLANRLHNEKVNAQNMLATAIIFVGTTLTVIFGAREAPYYSLDDLLALYAEQAFQIYGALQALFMLGLYVVLCCLERSERVENGLACAAVPAVVVQWRQAGSNSGDGDGDRKGGPETCCAAGGFTHIVCYGGIAGCFGGATVLLAKSLVELVKTSIQSHSGELRHWQSALLIVAALLCLPLQLRFLNSGLRRFESLVFMPVYLSFWITSGVVGGIVYFQEYKMFSELQSAMFILGTLITFSGIMLLLRDRMLIEIPLDDDDAGHDAEGKQQRATASICSWLRWKASGSSSPPPSPSKAMGAAERRALKDEYMELDEDEDEDAEEGASLSDTVEENGAVAAKLGPPDQTRSELLQ